MRANPSLLNIANPHSHAITRQLKDSAGGRIAARQSCSLSGEYCQYS
jgi:hypothetical protein